MLSLKLLKSCIISFDSLKNPMRDGVSAPLTDDEASCGVLDGSQCLRYRTQAGFLALRLGDKRILSLVLLFSSPLFYLS